MRLIDRYLFLQFLGPTLLSTLALSVVAILAEALSAIGVLLNQRQSPLIFLKIVALAMPQLIVLILPVAALVAGFVSINRLQRDHEIAICFAGGMSPWRVISPAIRLSALMAALSLLITLWIQPMCYRALRDTLERARTDLVATLIRPGQFTHPGPGVTVYAQSVEEDGTIHNLFIDQRLADGRDTTITAREGRLKRRASGPLLIMRHGANQELTALGVLNFLSFDNYILDLRPLLAEKPELRYKLSDRYPHELMFPDLRQDWERANIGPMMAEAHARMAAPLYTMTFMLLALSAVLGGRFNRLGYGARMAAASVAALVTRVLGFAVQTASGAHPILNVLQYALPLAVGVVCARMIVGKRGDWPGLGGDTPPATCEAPVAVTA